MFSDTKDFPECFLWNEINDLFHNDKQQLLQYIISRLNCCLFQHIVYIKIYLTNEKLNIDSINGSINRLTVSSKKVFQ